MYHEDEADEAKRRALEEARERNDRLHGGDWVVGRLLQHGAAPYRFDPTERESYFARLQTSYGREELWGADLKRAIQESRSNAKVGDAVGVRKVGRVELDDDRTLHRWQVDRATYIVKVKREAREILETTLGALRGTKEGASVTGADLLVAGAEILARVKFSDENSRKNYVATVREAAGLKPRPLEEAVSHDTVADFGRAQNKTNEVAGRDFNKQLSNGEWVGGRLVGHGKAPYRFDSRNEESYYVRLQTAQGRETVWGGDLARAIEASKSHVKGGDPVSLRIASREVSATGRWYNRYEIEHRMQLVKERRAADQLLAEPVMSRRAGQEGAAMTGSYLLIAGANQLARVQFTDDADRKGFVSKVREAAVGKARSVEDPQRRAQDDSQTTWRHQYPVQSQGFARE